NLGSRHLRLQVKRVSAKRTGSICKARGTNLQRAPVVPVISCRSQVGEPVLFKNSGIGGIGSSRIRAGMYRALHLPSPKTLREQRQRRLRTYCCLLGRGRICRSCYATQQASAIHRNRNGTEKTHE